MNLCFVNCFKQIELTDNYQVKNIFQNNVTLEMFILDLMKIKQEELFENIIKHGHVCTTVQKYAN